MFYHEAIFLFLLFMFGASLGSFTNNTAYRLAKEQSLKPRSNCEKCGTVIPALYLIPVFGYFFAFGRCRRCNYKIPLWYPFLEGLSGVFSFLFLVKTGLRVELIFLILISQCFLFIVLYDFRTKHILSYSIILLFLVQLFSLILWKRDLLIDRFLAMALGAGIFHLVSFFYSSIRDRTGLGEGDATLMGMLGFCFGKAALLPIIVLSSFLGILIGLLFLRFRGENINQPVPFAPALIAAAYFNYFLPSWHDFIF